jgi:hypothetical protein
VRRLGPAEATHSALVRPERIPQGRVSPKALRYWSLVEGVSRGSFFVPHHSQYATMHGPQPHIPGAETFSDTLSASNRILNGNNTRKPQRRPRYQSSCSRRDPHFQLALSGRLGRNQTGAIATSPLPRDRSHIRNSSFHRVEHVRWMRRNDLFPFSAGSGCTPPR